jgi:hypothetical protein
VAEAEVAKDGSGRTLPNYLARRTVLELCNYLMLARIDIGKPRQASPRKRLGEKSARGSQTDGQPRDFNMTATTAAFRNYVSGQTSSWHPFGDGIPRFSPSHCSTGSVLLLQALLSCDRVSLYGYHACSCEKACTKAGVTTRNHYWDKKETPRFADMMTRYEAHMLFYQRLERACTIKFRIARKEHCDKVGV